MSWVSVNAGLYARFEVERESRVLSTLGNRSLTNAIETIIFSGADGDTLRVMTPVIDDERVMSALAAARARGVIVKVLTTLADRHGIKTKGWDGAHDLNRHEESVRTLAKSGVLIRSSRTTPHGKFLLHNYQRGVFGSANLTKNSLRGTALESGILLSESNVVEGLCKWFDSVWGASPFRVRNAGGVISLEEHTASDDSVHKICQLRVSGDWEIWVSSPSCNIASEQLIRRVRSAENRIILVAMSFFSSDEVDGFQEALSDALSRGVEIRVVVRKDDINACEKEEEYPDASTRVLVERGLKLAGVEGLHAKGFSIDESFAGIHSANYNPFSLSGSRPECNHEVFLCGPAANAVMGRFIEWIGALSDCIPYEYRGTASDGAD